MYLSFSSWDWQRGHVTNWRSFFTKVKADARVAKAIWEKMDDRSREVAEKWLAGTQPEDEALKAPNYYTPDVRDAAVAALQSLLESKTLVDGADKLSRDKLAEANRRLIEQTFPQETVRMQTNMVVAVDIEKLAVIRKFSIDVPGKLAVGPDDQLYLFSGRDKVIALNPETGATRVVLAGFKNPGAIAVDKEGGIYVATGEPDHQVQVFNREGKLQRTIGKKGGRVLIGQWKPDGLLNVWGLAIDAEGKLWAAECDVVPKRFSVWNSRTGEFVTEYFGATHYGASGGTVNPVDPGILVGEGCEFRIDPETGRGKLLGIFTRDVYNGCARFCPGPNDKLYLAATFSGRVWSAPEPPQIRIWERMDDGLYAYRACIKSDASAKKTFFWADENGDEKEQPDEVAALPQPLQLSGYLSLSMNLNTDLTLYGVAGTGRGVQIKVAGFSSCGAPKYDLVNAKDLPPLNAPLPSPDNRLVLSCDDRDSLFRCYEVSSGKLLWTYPNTFHGVHGSHKAPGPAPGLVRGAFGFIGSAKLPKPAGCVWAINTNVGEWHLLTEEGYYLTRLFQGDAQRWSYPERALPGAVMDNCPPGLGGEDFGGSFVQDKDGKLHVQAGKVALWSVDVVGTQSIDAIKGAKVKITEQDAIQAELIRGRLAQAAAPSRSVKLHKLTPAFSGKLDDDFTGAEILSYRKLDNAAVRTAAAWDDKNLYLGWDVTDDTPWVNAAETAEFMYTKGDTVDFQLETDAKADKERSDAAAGDLRISIGSFKGTPTAIIYRKADQNKSPRTFSSGVVKEYTLDSVFELSEAKTTVTPRKGGYVAEVVIPLAAIGLEAVAGRTLRGDFGVTHGDANGQETALRTFWSNRATGIVNDEVFELKMEPANWGTLLFEE